MGNLTISMLQQHELNTMLHQLDECLRKAAELASAAEAWAKRAAEYRAAIATIIREGGERD